jgi:hypothetical protein
MSPHISSSRLRLAIMALGVIVLLGASLPFSTAWAQVPAGGKTGNSILPPTVELSELTPITVRGDYIAAGTVLRNIGHGFINIQLPANSTIVQAYMYWAVIRPTAAGVASNAGVLNGTPISGVLVGTAGTPCWPVPYADAVIDVFRADVFGTAVPGVNSLSGFPTTLNGSEDPESYPASYPMLEGASLVVVFSNNAYDYHTIIIGNGAKTFSNHDVPYPMGTYLPAPSSVADHHAKTTFIVADGQFRFQGDKMAINSNVIRGPGSSNDNDDGVPGSDGQTTYFLDGLWDTYSYDISGFLPAGVADTVTPSIVAMQSGGRPTVPSPVSIGGDCMTWIAQVLSIKSDIYVELNGPSPLCVGATGTYTLNNEWEGASYDWSFDGSPNGATLSVAPGGTSATVVAGTGNFTIKVVVSVGSYSETVTKTVTVNPIPTSTISAPLYPIYITTTGHTYAIATPMAGAVYTWTITNNTSGAAFAGSNIGQSVTVNAGGTAGQFTLNVTAEREGCSSSSSLIVPVLGAGCGTCSDHLLLANQLVMFNGQQLSSGKIHSNQDVLIHLGNPSTHTGNVSAVDDISIQKYNTIVGNVTAGGKLSLFQPVTISGSALGNQTVASIALPVLSYGSFTGANINVPSNHTGYLLNPGTYGDVRVYSYAVLKLRTGVYNFRKLALDKGVMILVDVQQGPVTVNVSNTLDFDKEEAQNAIVNGGSILFTVTTKQNTPLEFDKSSQFFGTYVAPNATVRMKWDHISFKGAICAQRIDIHKDCFFVDHSYTGSIPKQSSMPNEDQPVVSAIGLGRNYPNPFNPSTTIEFTLGAAATVTVAVYDVFGREVSVLTDGLRNAGTHTVVWNGTDAAGASMPSGTYYYRMTTGGHTESRQMTLAK